MTLSDAIKPGGRGVISTASAECVPNSAIYAHPHIIDEETVAWGMTESRTYKNVQENPHAAYLYINPGPGFSGVRLVLKLHKMEDSGSMLDEIKAHTAEIVSKNAGSAVKHVAYFKVTERRPLV
jgi:hypothetical protein